MMEIDRIHMSVIPPVGLTMAAQRPHLLAIGDYHDFDLAQMHKDYQLSCAKNCAAVAGLSEEIRTSISAIAYKGHDDFGVSTMDLFPKLKIIANYGVGHDSIDVTTATCRAIRVTNTPDVLTDDVADLAVAMMLGFSRDIIRNSSWVAAGLWPSGQPPLSRRFSGTRAGIVGLGNIGREIANRLIPFKLEIHYHSRMAKSVPSDWIFHANLVDMARSVDWLIVTLVGGSVTHGYVSRTAIDAMKSDSVIVNVSRGTTIDEGALIDALVAGRIRGAALDVFQNEPNIDPRFLTLTNVQLQPHQGSATFETRRDMGILQRANIAAFFVGSSLLTPVN